MDCQRPRFEEGFRGVMGVTGAYQVQVNGEAAVHRQRTPELLDETAGEIGPDHRLRHHPVEVNERATRAIHHYSRQRLVERRVGVPVAGDSLAITERLPERSAKCDADVLNGVVGVHRGITGALDGDAEATVLPERIKHVVEKKHPGPCADVTAVKQVAMRLVPERTVSWDHAKLMSGA